MQRLSRESLRAGPPKSRDPLSPIIYDTSRQAKKAYNRRKVTPVSAAEKRRIERLRELDERAEKIRCKEERKKQNALKRKQKEEKEGPKKLVKITSSQPELSKFFATKKEHAPATPKREEDRDGFREAEEPSEDPEEQSEPETTRLPLAEKDVKEINILIKSSSAKQSLLSSLSHHKGQENLPTNMKDRNQPQGCEQLDATTDTNNSNGNDAAASSCSSGSKDPDNKLVPNPRATNDTKPQIQPEQDAYSLQHRRPSCAAASDSKDDTSPGVVDTPRSSPPPPPPPQAVISSTNEENPTSEWDDAILTPRTLAKLDQNEDRLEEGSITRNEEDERYLETHRRETDYNDLDDDYDLKDDILFECFEGATSPIQENADDVDAQENDIESSQAAYRIGLSDPAFDELHELIDKEYKGPEADEPEADDGCEAGMNSSFLFDALEDDLRELDDM